MSVYVGLDCGGSSTRVLAIDQDGNVVCQGQSGAANLASTPESRIRRHLASAARDCPKADFVCGCFAGLVTEDLRNRGLDYLNEAFPGAKVRAEPDFMAVYYAAPPETDVCVIAGTGSLVFSLLPTGLAKSGGRGYILGDLGSGFTYGRDAINHFLDHTRDASPYLRQAISDQFKTTDPGEIVGAVYRAATPAAILGKLAKALAIDAKNGQPYALASIERNTRDLAQTTAEHVNRYLPDHKMITICLAGGVWKAAHNFAEQYSSHLRSMLTERDVNLVRVVRPPLYGAVELARQIENGN